MMQTLVVPRHLQEPLVADLLVQAQGIIQAAQDAGLAAKPFAITQTQEPGTTFYVTGPDWLWELAPLRDFDEFVPPAALRAMTWATAQGLSVSEMWVAAPARRHQPAFQPEALLTTAVLEAAQNMGKWTYRRSKEAAQGAARAASAAGVGLAILMIGLAAAPAALFTLADPVLVVQLPQGDIGVLVELARWK